MIGEGFCLCGVIDGFFFWGVLCGFFLVEEIRDGFLGGVVMEFLDDDDFDDVLEEDFDLIIFVLFSLFLFGV